MPLAATKRKEPLILATALLQFAREDNADASVSRLKAALALLFL
jgi:hypothetical protein